MKTATPQDTYDHTFGTGALMNSWWLGATEHGTTSGPHSSAADDWSVDVIADNGEGGRTAATVTHASVLKAARLIVSNNRPRYVSDITRRQCALLLMRADETDFDAASGDELLQVAVLGEIIYG